MRIGASRSAHTNAIHQCTIVGDVPSLIRSLANRFSSRKGLFSVMDNASSAPSAITAKVTDPSALRRGDASLANRIRFSHRRRQPVSGMMT